MQIGDFDQALADINQAIAGLPDEFAYILRGNIYRARGELAKSIDDYTRAYRLCPGLTDALNLRAEVYEQLGKLEEAQSDRAIVERAAAERAAAERPMSEDHKLDEARAFLAYLRENGVRLKIASNGRDLSTGWTQLGTGSLAMLERLKPQLLQLLAGG